MLVCSCWSVPAANTSPQRGPCDLVATSCPFPHFSHPPPHHRLLERGPCDPRGSVLHIADHLLGSRPDLHDGRHGAQPNGSALFPCCRAFQVRRGLIFPLARYPPMGNLTQAIHRFKLYSSFLIHPFNVSHQDRGLYHRDQGPDDGGVHLCHKPSVRGLAHCTFIPLGHSDCLSNAPPQVDELRTVLPGALPAVDALLLAAAPVQ